MKTTGELFDKGLSKDLVHTSNTKAMKRKWIPVLMCGLLAMGTPVNH